jgi:hypothetical protein
MLEAGNKSEKAILSCRKAGNWQDVVGHVEGNRHPFSNMRCGESGEFRIENVYS